MKMDFNNGDFLTCWFFYQPQNLLKRQNNEPRGKMFSSFIRLFPLLLIILLGQPPQIPTLSTPKGVSNKAISVFHESSKSLGGSSKDKLLDDLDEDDYDDLYDKEEEEEELDGEWARKKGRGHKEWEEGHCPRELEGRCHCGHQRDPSDHDRTRLLVNCTHAGFTNANFFKHVPHDTEVLIVRGNEIRELPQNIFDTQMDALKELDLSENGIEELKGKTFHHISNVDTLILNHNKIRQDVLYDHPRIFSNLKDLKYLHLSGAFSSNQWSLLNGLTEVFVQSNLTKLLKLHLEQNHISRIPNPRQFCDLKSLMDLHLGQNQLTDLRIDVEDDCLPTLRMVDLSYNQVRSVSLTSGIYQLLNHINQRDELVQVDLYTNPFNCDCTMDSFLLWMRNMSRIDPDRIRHRASLRCSTGTPSSNKNIMLLHVNHTECSPPLLTTNQVINRLSWTMLTLIVFSALLVAMALYLNKVGLPPFLRGICTNRLHGPLLSTATGVKYTSVDKEEVSEVAHV